MWGKGKREKKRDKIESDGGCAEQTDIWFAVGVSGKKLRSVGSTRNVSNTGSKILKVKYRFFFARKREREREKDKEKERHYDFAIYIYATYCILSASIVFLFALNYNWQSFFKTSIVREK